MYGDRLEKIVHLQNELQKTLGVSFETVKGLTSREKLDAIKAYCLAAFSKVNDVAEDAGSKWWKNLEPDWEEKIKDDVIDVICTAINLGISTGMDADEVYKRYITKSSKNYKKYVRKQE